MAKLIISGKISGEALEFAQGVLTELEGHGWVKEAIKAGLAHDPGDARDGALLVFKAMQMRAGETVDDEN
jgi:hypothetical protein